MLAAAVATMCGILYSPPASWDSVPLPMDAQVIEVPFAQLQGWCKQNVTDRVRGTFCYGMTLKGTHTAFISTYKTFPGTRECWLEAKRHEEAHIKGYEHP